jgi:hypothetical protein
VHLEHVGELGDPHLDRNRIAGNAVGQPAAVEPFERVSQRGLHVFRQSDPLCQQRRGRAV